MTLFFLVFFGLFTFFLLFLQQASTVAMGSLSSFATSVAAKQTSASRYVSGFVPPPLCICVCHFFYFAFVENKTRLKLGP